VSEEHPPLNELHQDHAYHQQAALQASYVCQPLENAVYLPRLLARVAVVSDEDLADSA
jgi:hypothetical protein